MGSVYVIEVEKCGLDMASRESMNRCFNPVSLCPQHHSVTINAMHNMSTAQGNWKDPMTLFHSSLELSEAVTSTLRFPFPAMFFLSLRIREQSITLQLLRDGSSSSQFWCPTPFHTNSAVIT